MDVTYDLEDRYSANAGDQGRYKARAITGCIVDEAAKRGIPFIRLNKQSLVQLGYGVHQKRIRATIASTTGNIAVDIACDKEETKILLGAAEIPCPRNGRTN